MDDLISRQAAIDEGMSYINGDCFCDKEDFAKYIEFIEQLPPIQPKRGKWIKTARWRNVYKCDKCGNYLDFSGVNAGRGDANYCPNCGAKMGGEQDG